MNFSYSQFLPSPSIEFFLQLLWEILGHEQMCLLSTLTPPLPHTRLLALWVPTLATFKCTGVANLFGFLLFPFFILDYENKSDAAADCGEVQDVLSTSGLKGNNWFLPTRLDRVNFANLHRPSSRPITSLFGKKAWEHLSICLTLAWCWWEFIKLYQHFRTKSLTLNLPSLCLNISSSQ